MQRFFEFSAVKFQCTKCGACCSGQPGAYVFVTDREVQRICQALTLTEAQFQSRFMTHAANGQVSLLLKASGDCVFLDDAGRCSIYKARPSQCRTYPFWPEIMSSEVAWLEEANRCEGIGRGESIGPEFVLAQLELVENPDGDGQS